MAKKLWKLFDGEPYFINPRKVKKGGYIVSKRRRHVRRPRFGLLHNFENPRLPFRFRRYRRRRNPDIRDFSKKVAGVSLGALTPIVVSSILPFDFGSKTANLLRDITYGGIGYAIARLYAPFRRYSNHFLVGAVAGSVVNYSKDRILELGFLKGLQASQALPPAQTVSEAKTAFYYANTEDPFNMLEQELSRKGLPPVLA